jgi:hypothetical protein
VTPGAVAASVLAELQDWLANATKSSPMPYPAAPPSAMALFGSYLQRSVRPQTDGGPSYAVPTLSMVGELDGLARVTRLAEVCERSSQSGCARKHALVCERVCRSVVLWNVCLFVFLMHCFYMLRG